MFQKTRPSAFAIQKQDSDSHCTWKCERGVEDGIVLKTFHVAFLVSSLRCGAISLSVVYPQDMVQKYANLAGGWM